MNNQTPPLFRDQVGAIVARLPPISLAIARQILERLEECHRLREAGVPAPIPTFDDLMERARELRPVPPVDANDGGATSRAI